ncbi:MAG TPA: diguanylate cyclase [Phycisphaerae bacterium]|nr:diguanylate cyclase [Phycisphaerae bacterium]HRY69576.1 diguanylate cyclase [Phycisphaerae bacterium]HSA29727.1 diguanylate cyclase [Phycisphaerae bacterium]
MNETCPHQARGLLTRMVRGWQVVRHSLQFKASLLVILLIMAVATMTSALALRSTSLALYQNELDRTREWAASLAATAASEVGSLNREPLNRLLDTLVRTPTVAYVAFTDSSGRIVAAAEAKPGLLANVLTSDGRRVRMDMLETPRVMSDLHTGMDCVDVIAPVYAQAASQGNDHQKPIVGYLRLATNVGPTKAKLANVGDQLVRITLGVLILVVPCSLVLMRYIVRPLNKLALTARQIAEGTTDARADVRSQNEIGQLARAFNLMTDRVMQSRRDLLKLNSELEARVEARTRELEELASRDPLTGLYNRRHFNEVVVRQFAAAQRYGADLTCLMFDLDHFKEINDRLGHRAGDEILILLAHSISSQLRTSDLAARFGGDEFIALLPQTSSAAATSLANRIKREFTLNVANSFPAAPATLSIGAASLFATHTDSPEALIHEADVALYCAKTHGRNRLVDSSEVAGLNGSTALAHG